jgi:site-specific recombinase XerC
MHGKTPGLYQRGKIWWISYYDAFGRRHRESVGLNYQQAVRARMARLADIEAGRFGLRRGRKVPTLAEFVEEPWRRDAAVSHKPSTRRGYEALLRHHLLPFFGDWPLPAITRGAVKGFIARKAGEQRAPYSRRNPNPNRPTLSRKTILNTVALLSAILEAAAVDYEFLHANPLRGILRRKNFPMELPGDRRVRVLEPDEFKRAVAQLRPPALQAVLFAALTGLRWSEQTALRIEEDMDWQRNRLRITRSLYRRTPQTPKTRQSIRDVVCSPVVRRILQALPRKEGFVFSKDGTTPLANGNWLKEQWRAAQVRAGIRRPIRWHDLRHQYVSFLIAIGKIPKYVAEQAGHASAGFCLDRYGHLFSTVTPAAAEWPEDLLWPTGCDQIVPMVGATWQMKVGEREFAQVTERQASKGIQL